MNTNAMPMGMITSDGNTWVQYWSSGVVRSSSAMPKAATMRPLIISGRGPTLGSTRATMPAVRMMPIENGKKCTPVLSAEYPSTACM